jgi:hypothetical protein
VDLKNKGDEPMVEHNIEFLKVYEGERQIKRMYFLHRVS